MATYPIPDLLNRWVRDELTAEQALGYMLQHLQPAQAGALAARGRAGSDAAAAGSPAARRSRRVIRR